MIKKEISLLAAIGFFALSCTTSQTITQSYTNVYDLHFSMRPDSSIVYPWIENAAYSLYTTPVPFTELDRTLFSRKYFSGFPFYDRLMTEYEQRILLPIHKEKEAIVTFEAKSENLKKISIVLDGLNGEEIYVFSDTVTFAPDNSLWSVSRKIPLTEIDLLNIRIHVEGKTHEDAYIAFSKLDIKIGDKHIDEYPVRELPKLSLYEGVEYFPIQPDAPNGCAGIGSLKNKKIIALGESIHGNSSVRRLVYKLIMENIETQNCRLVIWELPMEKSLVYNRYVTDNKFVLDSVEIAPLDEQRIRFLDELKQYNSDKDTKDKVQLLGMDYNAIWNSGQNSAIDVFDFVTHLNRDLRIPEVDRLSVLLMEEDWDKAVRYLGEHPNEIQELLTPDETAYVSHILTLSRRIGKDGIQRYINRDSVMFANTDFLLNYFSALSTIRTIVYAHSAHVSPVSSYPAVHCTPFGKYMKEKYPDDYFSLFFLIGHDSATVYDSNYNRTTKTLQSPPTGSLEAFLDQVDSDVFYYPLTSRFNKMVLSRFKGSSHILQEFYPYNLYRRCDGVIYIKNTISGGHKGKTTQIDEEIRKFRVRIEQRLKNLEEIKKRINK